LYLVNTSLASKGLLLIFSDLEIDNNRTLKYTYDLYISNFYAKRGSDSINKFSGATFCEELTKSPIHSH